MGIQYSSTFPLPFRERGGVTMVQWLHTRLPSLRLAVPTPDHMWESWQLLVGNLRYRTLTNCMYWFPLPTKLPIVIWPVQCWKRRKIPNKYKKKRAFYSIVTSEHKLIKTIHNFPDFFCHISINLMYTWKYVVGVTQHTRAFVNCKCSISKCLHQPLLVNRDIVCWNTN